MLRYPFHSLQIFISFYASFSVLEFQGLSTFLGLSSLLRLFCDQTSGIVSLKSNFCKTYGLYWVHGLAILYLYLTEVVFVYLFIDFYSVEKVHQVFFDSCHKVFGLNFLMLLGSTHIIQIVQHLHYKHFITDSINFGECAHVV